MGRKFDDAVFLEDTSKRRPRITVKDDGSEPLSGDALAGVGLPQLRGHTGPDLTLWVFFGGWWSGYVPLNNSVVWGFPCESI